jgi:hypothetical protein
MDSPIYLLDPASTLTGTERLAASQAPFDGSHGAVYIVLNDIVTFVSNAIGSTGDLTGTLTAGTYPVASGAKTLVNGRVKQDSTTTKMYSPNSANYVGVSNSDAQLRVPTSGGNSVAYAGVTQVFIQYFDSVGGGSSTISNSNHSIDHTAQIDISAPLVRLPYLTANTVPYLGSGNEFVSSATTPLQLSYLSTARSDLQVQIDALYSGLSWKDEVKAATTANITLSGPQTVDGISLVADDSVLVKNQTIVSQNGIYLVKAGAWVRRADCDSTTEIVKATVQIRLGTQANEQWSCSNTNEPVVGTDSITFAKINGGNTYTNGAGLTLTGSVFSISNLGVVNTMIANSTIDLTTKVTNVLPQTNGGKGNATVYAIGSIPFQNGSSALIEDNTNLFFDNSTKTFTTNNAVLNPGAGVKGLTINGNGEVGLYVISDQGGFDIYNTDASSFGGKIYSEGDGVIVIAKGIAGDYSSITTAGKYSQTGTLSGSTTDDAIVISRDFVGSYTQTGSIVRVISATGTGPILQLQSVELISGVLTNVTRFQVEPTGKTWYTQGSSKVSVSGSLGYSVAQTNNTNTSATDIYSYTIPASTLQYSGDTLFAEYGFVLSTATHTKQFTVSLGGTSLLTGTAFSLTGSAGSGIIRVTIIAANVAFIEYKVEIIMFDHSLATPVSHQGKSFYLTLSPDLTTDLILKVTTTCGAGSTTGEVVGNGAKYLLNPQF